jgi:hypothetical protein
LKKSRVMSPAVVLLKPPNLRNSNCWAISSLASSKSWSSRDSGSQQSYISLDRTFCCRLYKFCLKILMLLTCWGLCIKARPVCMW